MNNLSEIKIFDFLFISEMSIIDFFIWECFYWGMGGRGFVCRLFGNVYVVVLF